MQTIVDGGALAAGRESGQIAVGKWCDLCALDGSTPDLASESKDDVIDYFVFASDDKMITDLWSAGRHLVRDGQHVARQKIISRYSDAIRDLRAHL